ncbi:MAG TPA: hypothetical protein VJZ71_18730 [Phycisphaerae bacterium]|nr:hypothetical protein [Phycisphaerae bacterium]
MTAAPSSAAPPDTANLEINLAALRKRHPTAAVLIEDARGPRTLTPAKSRDGASTFTWTDTDERSHWLGRTTMPNIRAAALVDAFQPGDGNILLAGFGQGAEAQLLFARLAPHQAVMVVDDCEWSTVCVLRLYDFSREIREGRLLLFIGATAWQDLERFLTENDGYREPQRILSWPWFDRPQITEISQRLTEMNVRLAAQRAGGLTTCLARKPVSTNAPAPPRLAILSTVVDARIRRGAQVLSSAAESLGWRAEAFVLDHPARVHPLGIRRALGELSPTMCLLLDVSPSMMPYPLPEEEAIVFCTHGGPLSKEWLGRLGPNVRLGVVNELQQRQALEAGVSREAVLLVPPAAQSGLTVENAGEAAKTERLMVVADRIDASAEAAGLHLPSHRRLWEFAAGIVANQCDEYHDQRVAEVLLAAERQAKITLTSDDVRAGLIERIQRRLAPAVIRTKFLEFLHAKIGKFDLYGAGWENDPAFAKHHCGSWPAPPDVKETLSRYRTMIGFDSIAGPWEPLLDGLAAGLRCFHRCVGGVPPPLTDLDPFKISFASRAELLKLLNGRDAPESTLQVSRIMNERHTWAHRLQAIARFCQVV